MASPRTIWAWLKPLKAAFCRSTRNRKRGSAVSTVVSTSTTPLVFRKFSLTRSASVMMLAYEAPGGP